MDAQEHTTSTQLVNIQLGNHRGLPIPAVYLFRQPVGDVGVGDVGAGDCADDPRSPLLTPKYLSIVFRRGIELCFIWRYRLTSRDLDCSIYDDML